MARTKPQGKKKGVSKAKAHAKQGQDIWHSSYQVFAPAAAAAAAVPVGSAVAPLTPGNLGCLAAGSNAAATPTTDAVIPPGGASGTNAKESMAINFTGLSSYLTFYMALPWVLPVSLLISICLLQIMECQFVYNLFVFLLLCDVCYD
jgi:hypothetical protein